MSLSSKYGDTRDTADTGETLYSGDTVSLSSKYGEARDTADTGETLYSGDTVSLSSKYRAGAEAGASSEEEASVTRVQHTVQLLQENTQHYHLNTGRPAEPL